LALDAALDGPDLVAADASATEARNPRTRDRYLVRLESAGGEPPSAAL
jgi:hypothetical protein